jgi:hypothetical protein
VEGVDGEAAEASQAENGMPPGPGAGLSAWATARATSRRRTRKDQFVPRRKGEHNSLNVEALPGASLGNLRCSL